MKDLLVALCTMIVAAIPGRVAASGVVSEDIPVPGGTAAVVRALGFDTIPERGRFVAELTKLVAVRSRISDVPIVEVLRSLGQQPATELVPMPLTAAVWSDAVFHRPVAPGDLLFAILTDRQAALVCRGLAALDDDTLHFFAMHTALLTRVYEQHAAAFSVVAGSLHVRGDRIAPAGGDAAVPLWEAVVGAPVAQPDRFVVELLGQRGGRTAYLYDTVDQLDPAHRAFALGFWIDDSDARVGAMKGLASAWRRALPEWNPRWHPVTRPRPNPAAVLMRIRVDAMGAPSLPNSRAFWSRVFESALLPADPARLLKSPPDDRPVDAAWLVEAVGADGEQHRDRLDQVALAQRVFAVASAADMPDVLRALRVFPTYRMLLLTLERMGITHAATYAAASRLATSFSALERGRELPAIAQFQGALALLHRMFAVGTINRSTAEALVNDLIAVPLNADGRYAGALGRFFNHRLREVLPPADSFEGALIAAVSGPPADRDAPSIRWEGQLYRLDPAAAERKRLEEMRERQHGFLIDVALDLADLSEVIASASMTPAQIESAGRRLDDVTRALSTLEDSDSTRRQSVVNAGQTRAAIQNAIRGLGRSNVGKELKGASRSTTPLGEVADNLTAQALLSLAYSVSLGDADGAALLAGDVSRRHDFGFGASDRKLRVRTPWALPKRTTGAGVPWHVEGSLLGLDVALAPLGLHQLSADRALQEPTLHFEQREAFAVSHALMNPLALDDADRDAIVRAIDAGKDRLRALPADPDTFDALGYEIGMDGWRRRAVRWMLVNEPERVDSMFSLSELVALGQGSRDLNLQPWGMSAILTSGCLCTEMLPPGRWRLLAGTGELAADTADLNLHVARTLRELGLPARLAKAVLRVAVQDFVDEVRPTDADDWLTLVRTAQGVPRERIEDDLAAATARGPLVPEIAISQ